jgi:hypothetical protein
MLVCYNAVMSEIIDTRSDEAARAAELRELFTSISAVVQAGIEHDELDTLAIDLPIETVERAGEIYRAQS